MAAQLRALCPAGVTPFFLLYRTISQAQRRYFISLAIHKTRIDIEGGRQQLQISYHPDGSAYITIVPLSLGQVVLELLGSYPDYGIVHTKITLDVQPTQKHPMKLIVSQLSIPEQNATKIVLALTGDQTRNSLSLDAKYENLDTLVSIDPSFRYVEDNQLERSEPSNPLG